MNGNNQAAGNVNYLNGISQGFLPNGGNCPAPVQLVSPTGSCASPQEIRATPASSGIDPLALLNERCGTTSFPFTNAGSTSVAVLRWFGGCAEEIRPYIESSDVPLSVESAGFISNGSPFTAATGTFDAQLQAFNCITEGIGSIVSRVTFRGSDTSVTNLGDASLTAYTINPWSDFAVCKEEIFQNNCSPCITTNGTNSVVEWSTGLISLSSISGFYIPVAAAVSGRMTLCFAARGIQHMIPCGSIPVNCGGGY